MKDEEYEGYITPEAEAVVDEMAMDGLPRIESFNQYMSVLTESCVRVEKLYFDVPTITEFSQKKAFKTVLKYRERVYCYELYHQQRKLLDERKLHKTGLLLNAETDKAGTIYSKVIGRRKPDFILHRPGEKTHNVAVVEVKPISGLMNEIKKDLKKLKKFLDPKGMNYFGAVALVYGDDKAKILEIESSLTLHFRNYWPARFRALWHVEPGSRALIWNPATGKFQKE